MIVARMDTFLDGVPPADVAYFAWNRSVATLVVGTFQILQVNIGLGQVLDVSEIKFFCIAAAGGVPTLYTDEAGFTTFRGEVLVNRKAPWDVTALDFTVVPPTPYSGFVWFNRNLLADWSATPCHLLVPEGGELVIQAVLGLGFPMPPGVRILIGAEVHGRWLPQTVIQRLKEQA